VREGSKDYQPHDLLTVLVERNLISPAQAQLVQTKSEVTGMLTEDVLLARRWVTPETLLEFAPWLEQDLKRRKKAYTDPDEAIANHKKYRELTNKILDENLE